jgi:hypothetical protein
MRSANLTGDEPDGAELLTGDQVIDRLLERPALRRIALTCVLPAVRVGDEWRFRRTDLETWIQCQADTQNPRSQSN